MVKLRTVDDALRVLELLAERGELTTKEVATELGRSRSSAYRVVRTLHDRGWMSDFSGRYQLGPLAIMLGNRALNSSSVREIALPCLRSMSEESGETATLSVLVGWTRVCIEQVESINQIRMSVQRGVPFPLYAGASGRAILSAMDPSALDHYLDQTELVALGPETILDRADLEERLGRDRRVGYAVATMERDPEAFSVASPVRDRQGVLGSIALCGPMSRWIPSSAARYGALTTASAREISRALGWAESD